MEGEGVLDIYGDYISHGLTYESLTERSYLSKYIFDEENHYRLLIHSNKICLITLAPSHPIVKNNLNVTSINFQANENCNRLDNKVSGKKKAGAQFLSYSSILCNIQCEDHPQPFVVRSNIVAKLIEMNEDIAKNLNLLKDPVNGYLAVVHPKLSDYNRELERWMSEEEYKVKIEAENIDSPKTT